MESTFNSLPNQHTSIKEKKKESWYRPTYDYLISKAINQKDLGTITTWLDAANGIISNSTIGYAVTPLVSEAGETFEFPGEIRETDLINSIREKNMGEYIELPYRFSVMVNNSDAVEKRNIEVSQELTSIAQSTFITMLKQLQTKKELQKQQAFQQEQQTGSTTPNVIPPSQEEPNIPDFVKYEREFVTQWLDERAIQGQHILELINNVNNFDVKRLQSFFYWWATEEFYTYREIINGEVYTSNVSPLEGFPLENSELFVEDYDGFIIKKRITWEECIAKYKDKIPKDQKAYFDDLVGKGNTGSLKVNPTLLSSQWLSSSMASSYKSKIDSNADILLTNNSRTIDEFTTIWRTERSIKYVTRDIPTIGISQEIVEDDYELSLDNYDIKLDTKWIEEVWIGKRIGDSTIGFYLEPEPCDVQRYDKHRNRPKLPVGGKKAVLKGIKQNPVPARVIPFIIIDRLLTLNIERSIAKYRDAITVIPQSLLNTDKSGTYKEKMFFLKADGLLVYDDSTVDLQTVTQGFAIKTNSGLETYFLTLIKLKDMYRRDCLEVANMNPERMGDIDPSAGKGNTEQNIYRAKLGSLLSITMFNQALQNDHNADLEFSKVAYIGGKQGSYWDSISGTNIIVEVDPDKHLDSDYGVFVRNTKIDEQKIADYRNFAFSAAQNGEFELASAAIEADTVPELRKAIKEINEARRILEKSMADEKNQAIKYATDKQAETAQKTIDANQTRQDSINETAIRVAEIGQEGNLDNTSDIDIFSKADEHRTDKEIELRQHDDKMNLQARGLSQKDRELSIKEKQLKIQSKNKITK